MEPLQRTSPLIRTIASLALLIPLTVLAAPTEEPSRQASGVKAGEVTDTTAIVWVRLTASGRITLRKLALAHRNELELSGPELAKALSAVLEHQNQEVAQ